MSADFQVITEKPNRGAWLTIPEGLLAVIDGSGMQYVAAYDGDPQKTKSLPFAMRFDNGQLMLQIPNQESPANPIIVSMKSIAALVRAAKGIQ